MNSLTSSVHLYSNKGDICAILHSVFISKYLMHLARSTNTRARLLLYSSLFLIRSLQITPIDRKTLAGNEAGGVPQEEDNGVCDISSICHPSLWDRGHLLGSHDHRGIVLGGPSSSGRCQWCICGA